MHGRAFEPKIGIPNATWYFIFDGKHFELVKKNGYHQQEQISVQADYNNHPIAVKSEPEPPNSIAENSLVP